MRLPVHTLRHALKVYCGMFLRFSGWCTARNHQQHYRCWSSSVGSKQSIEDVATYIKHHASNILVMVGAGLSTASGIPDFRSPGTGLYDNLQKYDLPYPEAIFDIQFFMMDPRPFFALAQELYPGVNYKPNAAHHFLKLLHDEGKLQMVYTQNIDGLERLAGIPEEKLVEAHGSFATASCTLCGMRHEAAMVKQAIVEGNVPIMCEAAKCKVYPFAGIADAMGRKTPRVLINLNAVGSFGSRDSDVVLEGDIVENVKKLTSALGWEEKLNILEEGYSTRTIPNEE
ncbi:NAD-dependent protein deacetylase sirtuin-3, mitochondrial-like isoform X3 [Eriocheir sinensis]|uniref:NAD-dependent protein deacetylase sirtuin-3, mitochondrial-like isoform X3 n=1 Tax=Eriocheir sinensis TaxID=95602 RepID=UPI0021C81840|nr:NAD-dependent protein deacetylase sirtuin-3, mitochondrial-like isoform X3 [Eriocheir sinensis]